MPDKYIYPPDSTEEDTQLTNIEEYGFDNIDVYIGRESETYNLDESPFSNPFSKSEYGREDAIKHFKLYFFRRYLKDKEFRKALHSLEGDILGCWCYPKKCHGEIIVDVLNIHMEDGTIGVIEYMEDRLENHIDDEDLGVQGFREYNAAWDAIEYAKENLDIE